MSTLYVAAGSAESQNRTDDTAIFSRVLYQLSYLGLHIRLLSEWDFTRCWGDCQAAFCEFSERVILAGQILGCCAGGRPFIALCAVFLILPF